jgi:hypothetical protein
MQDREANASRVMLREMGRLGNRKQRAGRGSALLFA